jgi:hypothetical protein
MYQLIDQRTASLCAGRRFLLWAMRGWVRALGRGVCPPGAIAPVFQRRGVLSALPHLHRFLEEVNVHALDKVGFADPDWSRVTEWEAILLTLWSDVASGQADRALATLKLMLQEGRAVPALEALAAAEMRLSAAGLWRRSALGGAARSTRDQQME